MLVPVTVCQFLMVVLVGGNTIGERNEKMLLEFRVERIETDLKSFTAGVDLDFSYNETGSHPNDVVSSPGCPKSHEGRPWVYYGSTPKCYLVGFHGPCPHGKRMFSVTGSKYGVCNCECFSQESKVVRGNYQQTLPSPLSEVVDYSQFDMANNLVRYRSRQVRSHSNRNNLARQQYIMSTRMIKNPFAAVGKQQEIKPCNSSHVRSIDPLSEDDGISSYFLETPPRTHNVDRKPPKERYSFCYSNWYRRQVVYDSLRQECTPFLDQGPCQNGEWLVRNLSVPNGVACEMRKCPEIQGNTVKPEFGGSYSYFDYRRQTCYTEIYGNLQESFFANSGGILSNNLKFCRDAGLRYSQRLKTCVRDLSRELRHTIVG